MISAADVYDSIDPVDPDQLHPIDPVNLWTTVQFRFR